MINANDAVRTQLAIKHGISIKLTQECYTKLLPRLDRPRGEVHEPSPGWSGQGYMEVAGHDGLITTCCCDGGDVNLQELRRVSSTVELLWHMWAELGWPGHHTERFCQRGAAYTSHRGAHSRPGIPPSSGGCCLQVGAKVTTLDVESAVTRPLQ